MPDLSGCVCHHALKSGSSKKHLTNHREKIKAMKPAWTVVTYVRSEMPVNSKRLATVMSLTQVFFGENPPDEEVVLAAASVHLKNVEVMFSELTFTPVPEEFILAD